MNAPTRPDPNPSPHPGGASPSLTIDQAALAARTTTRNLRALQSMGLLPPPRRVGRRSYYDRSHLDRMRTVLRLQRERFSLESIRILLDAWEGGLTLGQVLGLEPILQEQAVWSSSEDPSDLFGMADWPIPGHRHLVAVLPSPLLERSA